MAIEHQSRVIVIAALSCLRFPVQRLESSLSLPESLNPDEMLGGRRAKTGAGNSYHPAAEVLDIKTRALIVI